jgi:hypothetical protein
MFKCQRLKRLTINQAINQLASIISQHLPHEATNISASATATYVAATPQWYGFLTSFAVFNKSERAKFNPSIKVGKALMISLSRRS